MEGIVLCFILLIFCVIGIANGPEKFTVFYEKDVQDIDFCWLVLGRAYKGMGYT